ncbi:MAG: class I SAM-dependent methyltransferase [Desulfobulbaceae bacterium]|nr:class I SAM-dependent methyltransferase [Desulfobulbaceae bacterium]
MNKDTPSDYDGEPEETFTPLPTEQYSVFYHLEMGGEVDDFRFYREQLHRHDCRSVLELGCGTGRLSDYLQRCGFAVTGIDNSRPMLAFAHSARVAQTIEMDMCRLGLRCRFTAAIIAWNTLNLLGSRQLIRRCLEEVAAVLAPGGLLLLHLYVPDRQLTDHPGHRFFQYRLLDLPAGGKLVKETLRSYDQQTRLLHLEERYKLRLLPNGEPNCNYCRSCRLAAFPATTWGLLLEQAGYTVEALHGNFAATPYHPEEHTTLLVTARRTAPAL